MTLLGCNPKKNPKKNLEKISIKSTEIEFNQINFSDIHKIESRNNGIEYKKPVKISLSKDYFPEIDKYEFSQPRIFRRDTANLDTQVSYFFTKNDSIVRLIEYSWDQDAKKKLYIDDLYKLNKEDLTKKLSLKGSEKSSKIDYWWQKIVRWDTDSTHVYSFIFGIEEGQRTRIIVRFKN